MKIPYAPMRDILFQFPPETSHGLSLSAIDLVAKANLSKLVADPPVEDPFECLGIRFLNRVGLAAGLDKDGDHIEGLAALGFGFLEIGTTTPRPQPGNPKPRMFRLRAADAIINRMGFNNKGVDYLCDRVRESSYRGVLGINIGKNKDTPAEKAADDYLPCLDRVYPLASYVTVNLSSPNTPGLRDLQFGEPLEQLLGALKERQAQLADKHGRYVPMLLKIAPDMADADLLQVCDVVRQHRIDALIATNTTIAREAVVGMRHSEEAGGLSGAPLTWRSNEVVRLLSERVAGELPLIGVGGIMNGADAKERISSGADLVQIYTGFIYAGPALINDAAAAIARGARQQA